jgi:hypothetical protein
MLAEFARQGWSSPLRVLTAAFGTKLEYQRVRFDGGSWGSSRPRLNVHQVTQMTQSGSRAQGAVAPRLELPSERLVTAKFADVTDRPST